MLTVTIDGLPDYYRGKVRDVAAKEALSGLSGGV